MSLTLASAQYPVTFHHSFEAWATHTEAWVQAALPGRPQLLLFPEYGSMELVSLLPPELRTDLRGQVRALDALCADFCAVFAGLARRYGVTLVAPSFPVCVGEAVYNRCFVFGPQGRSGYQDKYFMTRFETEDWDVRRAPARLCVFEADWGCFGIQICYDIEFPVGAALLCRAGAQVLLAPSCTETIRGSTRVHVGARARALEQQCFVLVSPLVGEAPWSPAVDLNYGFAALYSTPDRLLPEEGVVAQHPAQQPGWLTHTVDLSVLETVRRDGQTLNFRDQAALDYVPAGGAVEVVRVRI
ncbi:MAG: carbon-nitrogen hydrolase family protein [Saprospiraceae bacterium]|nr:carbon-nitrogen hydrolase family protein [Saprospiraceae bacterium]